MSDTETAQSTNGASSNGSESNVGRVDQVLGVVVDVSFPGELPEIYSALKIEVEEASQVDVPGHRHRHHVRHHAARRQHAPARVVEPDQIGERPTRIDADFQRHPCALLIS